MGHILLSCRAEQFEWKSVRGNDPAFLNGVGRGKDYIVLEREIQKCWITVIEDSFSFMYRCNVPLSKAAYRMSNILSLDQNICSERFSRNQPLLTEKKKLDNEDVEIQELVFLMLQWLRFFQASVFDVIVVG